MRRCAVAVLLAGLGACDDEIPVCEGEPGGVSAYASAGPDDALADDRPMVVVPFAEAPLALEDDLSCDPVDEVRAFFGGHPVPGEAWLPPERASVLARIEPEGDFDTVGRLRSPDGLLLWEGGAASAHPADGHRFRLVDDPEAASCTRDSRCILRAPIRMAVATDDGEVEIAQGEHTVVTIEGETFVAVAASAERVEMTRVGCVTDFGPGLYGSGYVARIDPVDLPLVDRLPSPQDDCPDAAPAEGDPCTTRADEPCAYELDGGCHETLSCTGCFWHVTVRSGDGPTCFDPADCMTNGDDGGCSEESVCTDCSCPGDERWRCVWPDDDCPAC